MREKVEKILDKTNKIIDWAVKYKLDNIFLLIIGIFFLHFNFYSVGYLNYSIRILLLTTEITLDNVEEVSIYCGFFGVAVSAVLFWFFFIMYNLFELTKALIIKILNRKGIVKKNNA